MQESPCPQQTKIQQHLQPAEEIAKKHHLFFLTIDKVLPNRKDFLFPQIIFFFNNSGLTNL
jgi:hypothetical protein